MTITRRFQLVRFGYLGHRFHGLALQPGGLETAGGALVRRFESALGEPVRGLKFAARTDAGVSARENYATFWTRGTPTADQLGAACTARDDGLLRVRAVLATERSCARTRARSKRYVYRIDTGSTPTHEQAWWVAPPLKLQSLRDAARTLIGRHDFATFRAARCDAKETVCEILAIDVSQHADVVEIHVSGTRFLRRMVRIVVGTLVEAAAGVRDPDLTAALAAQRRGAAGIAAPARGLCLDAVDLVLAAPERDALLGD